MKPLRFPVSPSRLLTSSSPRQQHVSAPSPRYAVPSFPCPAIGPPVLPCHCPVDQPDPATSPDDVSMTSSDLDPTNDVMLTSARIRAKSIKRSILAKNSRFLSFWCVRRYSALHANYVQSCTSR
jgi:hypothetical protein